MRTTSSLTRAALITLVGATTLGAQRAVVRVTAQDSSGAPVTSAELTIVRGIRDVVGLG